MEDDRYLLHLHDSERYIASLVELHCAEYLFVKRAFFRDLYIVSIFYNNLARVQRLTNYRQSTEQTKRSKTDRG